MTRQRYVEFFKNTRICMRKYDKKCMFCFWVGSNRQIISTMAIPPRHISRSAVPGCAPCHTVRTNLSPGGLQIRKNEKFVFDAPCHAAACRPSGAPHSRLLAWSLTRLQVFDPHDIFDVIFTSRLDVSRSGWIFPVRVDL